MDGALVGGIHDDRLLVKCVEGDDVFVMEEAVPYPGAKKMWLVGEVDDAEALAEIVQATVGGLKEK